MGSAARIHRLNRHDNVEESGESEDETEDP